MSETEDKLMKIWMEALQLPTLGLDESFLDLGGDSLTAMSCISRIRADFGVEFPLEEFFLDGASISEFARIIDRLHDETHHQDHTAV